MLEPERVEASAKYLYSQVYSDNYCDPGGDIVLAEWDTELDDESKESWRRLAVETYNIYLTARPGPPCTHAEYYDTGRCAEMACSNYVNKHRPPMGDNG